MFRFFFALGIWGPFSLSIIDALLFAPLANDVLIVALTARHHNNAWIYAVMATAGSLLGCLVLDALSRKGGEAGLKKTLSPRRFEQIKKRVGAHAGWAVALGGLMPPPFPFTAVIIGAAALQYPRVKMMSILAATRALRFGLLVWLAVLYGRQILRWADLPAVRWSMIGLIVICVAGSGWTIWSRMRTKEPASRP